MLVADGHFLPVVARTIEVVGQGVQHVRLRWMAVAHRGPQAIEPNQIGTILVDHLIHFRLPLVGEFFGRTGECRPVEVRVRRIKHVPVLTHLVGDIVFLHRAGAISEGAAVMEGSQELHIIVLAYGRGDFAVDIPLGPHVLRIPTAYLTIP